MYNRKQVSVLTGVPVLRLREWEKLDLIPVSIVGIRSVVYDDQAVEVVKQLQVRIKKGK